MPRALMPASAALAVATRSRAATARVSSMLRRRVMEHLLSGDDGRVVGWCSPQRRRRIGASAGTPRPWPATGHAEEAGGWVLMAEVRADLAWTWALDHRWSRAAPLLHAVGGYGCAVGSGRAAAPVPAVGAG